MQKISGFANFTVVNSHFRAIWCKRKLAPGPKNREFSSPTLHLETQTRGGFQCRTERWQITIFDFLEAQLDFLAKLSSSPYSRTKTTNLRHSSSNNNLSKYYNYCGK